MNNETDVTVDLYAAVEEMKRITADGGTFAIRFRKWDRQRARGGDMVYIPHARLRPKPSDTRVENASYKLFLTDADTGRAVNCWQCLVMEVEGKKTVLS